MNEPYIPEPYVDDSDITEIIIQPDGRIYAFGLSMEVAAVLESLERTTDAPLLAGDSTAEQAHVTAGETHDEA